MGDTIYIRRTPVYKRVLIESTVKPSLYVYIFQYYEYAAFFLRVYIQGFCILPIVVENLHLSSLSVINIFRA